MVHSTQIHTHACSAVLLYEGFFHKIRLGEVEQDARGVGRESRTIRKGGGGVSPLAEAEFFLTYDSTDVRRRPRISHIGKGFT